ncbi:hypothetical protein BDV12DRAFT_203209 [Aspergillus spectabilis]
MSLSVDGLEAQLSLLFNMTGVKRILSIGGWDFSTDADTYMIFREAVTVTNRDYPNEPDIPGIPAGTTTDSTNYYLTLRALKAAMSTDKTVSVTAPASFWYLERFPIEAISSAVDYIVYMTYDLHGQWDYGSAFADSGCDDGNCLRSHVNLTETLSSLSMITKAGVSSNKVAVGVVSYARSFEMTEAGCWTDMCTYTGDASGAWPGPCTDTSGYIANYELDLVMAENPTAELYWDDGSYTDILVFNETQRAGFMNNTNKEVRIALYEQLGFLGSEDWAVDLQSEDGNEEHEGSGVIYIDPIIFSEPSPTVAGYPPFTMVWPTSSLATPMVVNFPPYLFITCEGGVPTTSWVSVPSTMVSHISFFQWEGPSSGIPTTTFNLVSSFSPSPVTVVVPDNAFPSVLYPPPIESPYTPQVGVVDGSSYTVMSGTIMLNGGGGTSLITYLPSPTITTQTVTETVYVEDNEVSTSTVVVVILPTTPAASLTEYTLTSTTLVSGNRGYSAIFIILPIDTGGFYWSPVSKPNIPLPTVNPPDLPPIPTPSCFTLSTSLLSTARPTKTSHKTTHYTSAKNSPTCSPSTASSCGALYTTNCDASSTSTETTSTSTTCTSETTVTDYWVSCGETACSITSSTTFTGCDVTATTTTTGLYCQASAADVYPEEFVAAGTTYVGSANGVVTLGDGDVITVPTVSAGTTTVVTIGTDVLTIDAADETVITVIVTPIETSTSSSSETSESSSITSKTTTSKSTTTGKTATSTTSSALDPSPTTGTKYAIGNN